MGVLSQEDIDRRIAGLGNQVDTVGASLADLDGDVTLKLLASATLTGPTAAEWARVSPRLALLWACYGALKDKLAQVVALRAARPRLRAEDLEALSYQLLGDSVALPPDPTVPVARSLTTSQRMASLAWVQDAMATMFHDVVSVVDRVGAAWAALPRLDALDADLTGLTQSAGQAGLKPPPEAAAARARITDLRGRLRADPLGADPAQVAAIEAQMRAAAEVLAAAKLAHDELAGRLAATGEVLAATGGLAGQLRTARAEASEKIAGIAAGTADADGLQARVTHLRANLDDVTALARADWQEAHRLLGELDQQADALQAETAAALRAVREPMARRDELRGRLDAYHAKALAIGLAEDAALDQRYARAKDLVYTAPCDLVAAEAAVRAYSTGLSGGLSRPRDVAG